MNLATLALAMLSFSSGIMPSQGQDELRIVGGEKTKEGGYPSVVAVVVERQLCAATVVSPKLLVTAAHCFSRAKTNSRVLIHQGESIEDSRTYTSQRWATHPDYCGKEDCKDESYDYAYIELEEPLKLDHYPRPLTSQQEYDQIMQAGRGIVLVGYGENDQGMLGEKRQVDTSIAVFTPLGRQFLTSGDGKDSCRGDSGGPAFGMDAQGKLLWLGVLSSGARECGKGGYYGVPLPILSWLNVQTGFNPGGCISEDCIQLAPDVPDSPFDPKDPPGGSCTANVSNVGLTHWGLGFLVLAALGRMRRTRPLSAQA